MAQWLLTVLCTQIRHSCWSMVPAMHGSKPSEAQVLDDVYSVVGDEATEVFFALYFHIYENAITTKRPGFCRFYYASIM